MSARKIKKPARKLSIDASLFQHALSQMFAGLATQREKESAHNALRKRMNRACKGLSWCQAYVMVWIAEKILRQEHSQDHQ